MDRTLLSFKGRGAPACPFSYKTGSYPVFITISLWIQRQVKTPPQATGHPICNAVNGGVFNPRGSRQMVPQACPSGSLPAGISENMERSMKLCLTRKQLMI